VLWVFSAAVGMALLWLTGVRVLAGCAPGPNAFPSFGLLLSTAWHRRLSLKIFRHRRAFYVLVVRRVSIRSMLATPTVGASRYASIHP
jgi:hypothetical protein